MTQSVIGIAIYMLNMIVINSSVEKYGCLSFLIVLVQLVQMRTRLQQSLWLSKFQHSTLVHHNNQIISLDVFKPMHDR